MNLKPAIVAWAAAAAVGMTGILGYTLYKKLTMPAVDTSVAVLAAPAPALLKVKKVRTPVKQVMTYAPEAKAKLKLPPAVIADVQQQVTSATTVEPGERRQTVTSVLNVDTGETVAYVKPEPLPWLVAEARGEARFDLGYKVQKGLGPMAPKLVGRLSIVHDFVQVKGFHAGVNVAVDTDGTAFAGAGIGYRW